MRGEGAAWAGGREGGGGAAWAGGREGGGSEGEGNIVATNVDCGGSPRPRCTA